VAVVCGMVGIGIMIVVAMVITSWCIVRCAHCKEYIQVSICLPSIICMNLSLYPVWKDCRIYA
jgi:hypothetical protein